MLSSRPKARVAELPQVSTRLVPLPNVGVVRAAWVATKLPPHLGQNVVADAVGATPKPATDQSSRRDYGTAGWRIVLQIRFGLQKRRP